MLIFIVIILLLLILDIAALRWGADTRDEFASSKLGHYCYQSVNR
jgi:hypothetical protein